MKNIYTIGPNGYCESARPKYYILDTDDTPIPATLEQWATWFAENDARRKIADEDIGGVRISTVFLGLDHNVFGEGPPDIYETMIFGGPLDQALARCATRAEAEEQHKLMAAEVRAASADIVKLLTYRPGPV